MTDDQERPLPVARSAEAVVVDLVVPLDERRVQTRASGGGRVPYLEGWDVIAAANAIFGFDGWTYELVGPVELVSQHKRRDETVSVYQARVVVEALGRRRGDVGIGITADDRPESHDTAIKGAATDALKRALRTFGAQFGLDLYDKGAGNGNGAQQAPSQAAAQAREEQGGEPHFANVGAMLTWASREHAMARPDVLRLTGCHDIAELERYGLDRAARDIDEHSKVSA